MKKEFCDKCENELTPEDVKSNESDLYKSLFVTVELSNGLSYRGRLSPDKGKLVFCISCRRVKMAESNITVKDISIRLPYHEPIEMKIG